MSFLRDNPEDDREDCEDVNVINARQSIHNIKNRLHLTIGMEFDEIEDDRQWVLSHLKKMFKSEVLQRLFEMYIQRLHQAFFALLMLVQVAIFGSHFIVIVFTSKDPSSNVLELSIYGLMICFSVKMFFVTDGSGYVTLRKRTLKIITIILFVLLNAVNLVVPLYYFVSDLNVQLRPAYTTHIVISCYVFFFISDLAFTVVLGLLTTIIHILILVFITYYGLSSPTLISRISSDVIYLFCINGLGIYYRYLNEIIKRKSFLDRRALVIFNKHLEFQKEQEELLMATLIPSYVIEKVRNNIYLYWDRLENLKLNVTPFEYKTSFTQIFENVTILFADVVNYTELTVKLNPTELLETLNDLFGSFDDVSDKLGVLRIKFLGDCYYCVAGLPPKPTKNHAEACVDLGLEMIRIIKEVRAKRRININMRIGIHTGKIISGIIGYQKIHFDIWSKDVSLANQMETEGEAGKIHLTQQTKDLLKKRYNIEPTNKGDSVPKFKNLGIKTYLISPEDQKSSLENKIDNIYIKKRNSNITNKRISTSKTSNKIGMNSNSESAEETTTKVKSVQYYSIIEENYLEEEKGSDAEIDSSPRRTAETDSSPRRTAESTINRNSDKSESRDSQRRAAFMNGNIKRYQEVMRETYDEMSNAIENLCLTKYQQWFKFKEINPLTLLFTRIDHELGFIKMQDPLYKYYLLSEVILVIFLFIIQNLTLSVWNWESWWIYATLAVLLFIFLPITWMHHILKRSSVYFLRTCATLSKQLADSVWTRLFIYSVVSCLFTLCVFSELIDCQNRYSAHETNGRSLKVNTKLKSFLHLLSENDDDYGICIVPWHMTQTCALAVIMSFLFLRMFMWIKFAYALMIASLYSICVWCYSDDIIKSDGETYNYNVSPKVSHIIGLIVLTFTLHIIDRQTEYMNRLDFLWNEKLREEQSKTQSRYIINKMLLNNVLPEHLATMYLNIEKPPAALYYEEYANAAVMFASVIGYQIEDIGDDILLTIMTEIIGDFDKF
ncbi:adenylate cyclase type 7-like isoform X2 [Harmonia axyridis]|uniref:adenylate cyclase type 7-like isoform X2 n=1 Tax=Harmonia axyridis TaxID=115357 RepID=UPI001E276978|nr:adenylate cyclase type 7-like isoform X2 [Harmonia axyridis]